MFAPEAGLCAECAHCRRVPTARNSVFHLCRRAESDPRYVRYPRLPVASCPGFEKVDREAAALDGDES